MARSRLLHRALLASVLCLVGACGDDGGRGQGGGDGGAGSTAASTTSSAGTGGGAPGGSATIAGCAVFPADNAWNQDVSGLPVHPDSDAFIDAIGRSENLHPDFGTEYEGAPIGIPFVVVSASQPEVAITYTAYGDESDPGPFPVPLDAPVEGGPASDGDRHVLVLESDSCTLYELYRAFPTGSGWEAESGAEFDLTTNDHHPETWTSADAAGLPILPGLVRYEEVVERGVLEHAVRMTVERSQAGYIFPARHYASSDSDPTLPPMGLRLRMKASYDCGGLSTEAQVVCAGLKKYGLLVADNGSPWFLSGQPDPRWDDDALNDLKGIPGDAFEVVETGPVETY